MWFDKSSCTISFGYVWGLLFILSFIMFLLEIFWRWNTWFPFPRNTRICDCNPNWNCFRKTQSNHPSFSFELALDGCLAILRWAQHRSSLLTSLFGPLPIIINHSNLDKLILLPTATANQARVINQPNKKWKLKIS